MESLTLQVDGPIAGMAYIRRAYNRNIFFGLHVDGPITGMVYERGGGGGGGGLISGMLWYLSILSHWTLKLTLLNFLDV